MIVLKQAREPTAKISAFHMGQYHFFRIKKYYGIYHENAVLEDTE